MAPKNTKNGDGEKAGKGSRGKYTCNKGQCREKLKLHVCSYAPKYRPPKAPSDKTLETKTAAVQANGEEHMTLARMEPSFYSPARANESEEVCKASQDKEEAKKPESEQKTTDGQS